MKRTLITLTILTAISISCKKEVVEETPPTATTTDNDPTIAITEPDENFTVNIGSSFNLEGVASDVEALQNIHYSIESPNASYNYISSEDFNITGTSEDFSYTVNIPTLASVGNAKLDVYAVDSDNNESLIITRNFKIGDTINPNITRLTDSVHRNDSLIVTVYRNPNQVVDSLEVFNYTTSQIIARMSDIGGFKTLEILKRFNGINPDQGNLVSGDLTLSTNVFAFKVASINDPSFPDDIVIGITEYDNTFHSPGTFPSGKHIVFPYQ